MNPFFVRMLQRAILTVGTVVGKSIWDAYKIHSRNLNNAGAAGGAGGAMWAGTPTPMSQPEACRILGINVVPEGKPLSKEDIKQADENFLRLMKLNAPKEDAYGGSEYLQSKLFHAHQYIRRDKDSR